MDVAIRTQAAGLAVALGFDPVAVVTRLRATPPPEAPSFFGWQAPLGRASGFVGLSPDAARGVAAELRRGADQLRRLPGILSGSFTPLGLDVPSTFQVVSREADAVADEILRRVRAFEDADADVAGQFRALDVVASVSGPLRPLEARDPFGSAVRRVMPTWPPPPAAGPGSQPTQAKEADPVSTSTGNYFLQVVDLAQPARGLPTVFARTYNSSRARIIGPLGPGWSHSYDPRLTVDGSGATVEWGDATRWADGGGWRSDTGEHSWPPGTLVLARQDSSGHRFVHPGLSMEVATVTDEAGTVTSQAHYDPSGNDPTAMDPPSAAPWATSEPWVSDRSSVVSSTCAPASTTRRSAASSVPTLGRRACRSP